MKKSSIILILILTAIFSSEIVSMQKETIRIALVYPKLTKSVLYKTNESFRPAESWELFFMRNQYAYEMVNDDELGSIGEDIDVVIIPSMEAVDEEIIENLNDLLKQGKGVLITGEFAEYNDEGIRISDDYQRNNLGFRIARLSDAGALSVNHSLKGNTPLSIGLKPGQKILLKYKPVLYYSYELSQGSIKPGDYLRSNGEFSGVVMNISPDKRILWFGFDIDQIIGETGKQFLNNSIKWLSSVPEAFINCWPAGYTSAAVIYKNIDHPADAYEDHSILNRSIELNYFVSPGIFENSRHILNELWNPGNINLLWDDFFFSTMSVRKKDEWLKSTSSFIKSISDQNYSGIYCYGGIYMPDTYKLLSSGGYSFVLSSGYSDSYSFNRDTTNHIYVFNESESPGTDFLSRAEFVLEQGGISFVNIDSLGEGGLNFLQGRECWITTFSDLLEWLTDRDNIELTIHSYKKDNFDINIRNRGSSSIMNTALWISVPGNTDRLKLENASGPLVLTFDYEKNMYSLKIPALQEFQSISVRLISSGQL